MKTLLSLLFSFLSIISLAQVEKIDRDIADYDAEIAKAISEHNLESIPRITTACYLMLPAIGPVYHNIEIYFDHLRMEGDSNESATIQIGTIRKVYFQINSGSYNLISTFYFDKTGNLTMHNESAEDVEYGCTQRSYYFKADKCIQLKSELLETEFCELPAKNQPDIRTELSDLEKTIVKNTLENAKRFKKILDLYIDLMFN